MNEEISEYSKSAWKRMSRKQPAFQSVILAGVYDIKNLKLKIWRGKEYNERGEKQLIDGKDYAKAEGILI